MDKSSRFIGIDVSLNSTGVTVLDDTVTFYSLFRTDKIDKFLAKPIVKLMQECNVVFLPTTKLGKVTSIVEETNKKGVTKKIKVLDYSLTEVNKTVCNLTIAEDLQSILDSCDIVSMEGMAYGAKGSAIIDIAMLTGVLRSKVIDTIDHSKFKVFSPSEIKKFATESGAANKNKMLEMFLLEDNSLAKCVNANYSIFVNSKDEIQKPLDDLIDSYFAAKMVKSLNI